MVTKSEVEKTQKGWYVNVYLGNTKLIYGPYRYRWIAVIIAWLEDGQH